MTGGPDGALAATLRPQVLCEGVRVLFTGRFGGASRGAFSELNLSDGVGDDPSAVAGNRELVLRAIGSQVWRLSWMRQVHGTEVVRVDAPHVQVPAEAPAGRGLSPRADAAFTASPGVALGALGADCAAVLIADPAARLVGAAHAGRPGMAAGVVPELISAMAHAGAEPGRMHAIIGPSICGLCYEVPARMRDEVAALVPGSACVTRGGRPAIDLRAGLHGQLARSGVTSVGDDRRCTAESVDLYSYRRDGATGRFAGLIWLAP